MFLNTGMLRRLMKQEFKTGLRVAQTTKRLYLAGRCWAMDVREEFLPKEILATVIELTGGIPQVGEAFKADKGGNQMEQFVETEVRENIFTEEAEITPLILQPRNSGRQMRILQTTGAEKIHLVNEDFIRIADGQDTETELEEQWDRKLRYGSNAILWKSSAARFMAMEMIDRNRESLLAQLEELDLMMEDEL